MPRPKPKSKDRPSDAYWDAGLVFAGVTLLSYGLYQIFKPKASFVATAGRFGSAVLLRAQSDLGVRETTPNGGPRVDQMLANFGLGTGVNWCAAATGTWILEAANEEIVKRPIQGSASARSTADQMKNGSPKAFWIDAETLRGNPSLVSPGMIVVWTRGGANTQLGHIGLVSRITSKGFRSIEGNSGALADGVYEWDHDIHSDALLGMGGWEDDPIYADPASGPGVGYVQDPPGAELFNSVAPELEG